MCGAAAVTGVWTGTGWMPSELLRNSRLGGAQGLSAMLGLQWQQRTNSPPITLFPLLKGQAFMTFKPGKWLQNGLSRGSRWSKPQRSPRTWRTGGKQWLLFIELVPGFMWPELTPQNQNTELWKLRFEDSANMQEQIHHKDILNYQTNWMEHPPNRCPMWHNIPDKFTWHCCHSTDTK